MDYKYSIGQMAKLFNLSVKTLRFYDQIDLFKPAYVNERTGYRYYTIEQFEHLSTIIFLKILGMPLKVIKSHLDNPNIDAFLLLLKDKQAETERRISELQEINKKFEARIKAIEETKKIKQFNQVIIKKIEKRRIVLLKEDFTIETHLELLLKKLEKKLNMILPVIIGNVALRMAKKDMLQASFNHYNAIGMFCEEDLESTVVDEIESGLFACIYFKGYHKQAHRYYRKLIQYIKQNNYAIIGDSVERTISNQFITEDKEYHITEIQIPVSKLSNKKCVDNSRLH